MGIRYALASREDQSPEELCERLVRQHVHGLIDLGRYEAGGDYEVTRTERWDPHSADNTMTNQEIRYEVLAAAERMARSEAGSAEVPSLDVDGVADVLEVDPRRIREELTIMQIERLIEVRAATFGHGLEEGALRITASGIATLQELRRAGRRPTGTQGDESGSASATAEVASTDYDVALSFAGEQRGYVEQVAAILAEHSVRVFYDEYETVDLWGKDLYEHLDDVYRRRSRHVVIFVSSEYAEKVWPRHEQRSAQARALQEQGEYILPVRFDDTELPGLRPTVGYIDARTTQPEDLAAAVLAKLGLSRESELTVRSDALVQEPSWHVDLVFLWDENGRTRYAVRWEAAAGFVSIAEGDPALGTVQATAMPPELPIDDAIRVGHLRGKHLKFDFECPVSPVKALLHHGGDVHEATGIGAGADEFVDFNLERWPEIE